jgi:hypothetical protein
LQKNHCGFEDVPKPWERDMSAPGRVCPVRYRYGPAAIARAPERLAETLYVIGGLSVSTTAIPRFQDRSATSRAPATFDRASCLRAWRKSNHRGSVRGRCHAESTSVRSWPPACSGKPALPTRVCCAAASNRGTGKASQSCAYPSHNAKGEPHREDLIHPERRSVWQRTQL